MHRIADHVEAWANEIIAKRQRQKTASQSKPLHSNVEKEAKGKHMAGKRASSYISEEDSDDGGLTQTPSSGKIMKCSFVEINAPVSLHFRDAFGKGHTEAHKVMVLNEGYRFGTSITGVDRFRGRRDLGSSAESRSRTT